MGRAAEASIGDERDTFAEARADDVACRRKHLLHAGAALRTLVADHDHVARLHLTAENALAGLLLAVEADRLAREVHHGGRHAALLHHGATLGKVAPM